MRFSLVPTGIAGIAILLAVGCGDDAAGPDGIPDRIIEEDPASANTPGLPRPNSFGERLPDWSDELLLEERTLVGAFNPLVSAAHWAWHRTNLIPTDPAAVLFASSDSTVYWDLVLQRCAPNVATTCTTAWYGTGFSSGSPPRLYSGGGLDVPSWPTRVLLMKTDTSGNPILTPPVYYLGFCPFPWLCIADNHRAMRPLHEADGSRRIPVVRHYAVWHKVIQVELANGTAFAQGVQVARGVEKTEGEEFSRSISVSAGGGNLFLTVTATLTQTFSRSITISEQTTLTSTFEAPEHKDGMNMMFVVWQLADRYRIEDVDHPGQPWSQDGSYEAEEMLVSDLTTQYRTQRAFFRAE